MRKIYFLLLTILFAAISNAQVSVTATAGTVGPTPYTTLKGAFDAINAGTHQGAITIDITANTTEGLTPATLNSSGAGSASYTAVLIRPTADGVSISGNPITGFGVIQLKGADNVTIDGDNPNTGGTNRNLTVNNTTTTTVIANSAIRIATSAAVTSADNITIKNCNLNGNVTSGNSAAITSTTGSSNSSFGIYIGGNGGATATDAPTAITSVTSNTAPSGTTINNLLIDNNTVNQCARAIVFNGAATSVGAGLNITNNTIGTSGAATPATPPYTSPATTVYTKGIWVAGTSTVTISGNTLQNILSYVGTTMTAVELVSPNLSSTINNNTVSTIANNGTVSIVKAILVSNSTTTYTISGNTITNIQAMAGASGTDAIEATTGSTSAIIEKNKVTTVYNRNTGTFGAWGINVTAGTGVTIRNNFISDLNMDMTSGAAFSTTFGVLGVRLTGGTGHKVYHNSVNLSAALLGTATTSILTTAFAITSTAVTGVDVRNNIFSNVMTGGTTSIAHVAMFLPSGATSTMNLTLNNNVYYSGADAARQGIAQVGTTAGTGFYLASNFNSGAITPATNLRSYTSTLSAAGTNDNASFGSTTSAPFTSSTNLHIPNGTPTILESSGAPVGVADDIDAEARSGTTPDIGADEFSGIIVDLTAPFISYTPLGNTTSTANRPLAATVTDAGSGVPTSGVGLPVIYFRKGSSGAYSSAQATSGGGSNYNFTIDYSLVTGGSVVVGDLIQYYVAAQDGATTPNVALNPSGGASGLTSNPPAASTPPTTPNSYLISVPISGIKTVCASGCDYTTLTGATGIFNAINSSVVTGNIEIQIAGDLTVGEDGTNGLNVLTEQPAASNFTVKIYPTGVARTISGSFNGALIRTNGSSRVTIDGSIGGTGTDRSLSIVNNSITGPSVILFGSIGTTPITNNSLKNCIITNGVTTNSAVVISDAGTVGNQGYFSNITIQNNDIRKAYIGVYATGGTTPQTGSNLTYTQNTLNSTGTNAIRLVGLYMQGVNGAIVTQNTVSNIDKTNDENDAGIWLATGAINASVANNTVSALGYTGINSFAPTGIVISSGVTGANVDLSGNNITDISTAGSTTVRGIAISGATSDMTIQKNNVQQIINSNTGTFGVYGIDVSGGNNINVRNNFVSNVNHDMTGGAAFSTTFGVYGIRVGSGTGHKVYHNSVNLYGLMTGTPTTSLLSAAFAIVSTASTGCDVRNNIFANNITGGTTSIAAVSAYLPSGGSAAMGLTWNNNAYYFGTDVARQGVGQAGTTAGTNFYTTLAALTAYTNTLGNATNDNRSSANTSAVPFISSTNLHIDPVAANCNISNAGAALGVADDIDGNARNAVTPDIGADEFSSATEPTITLGSNPAVCPGSTTANLPYSATTNSPNQYSIDFDAAAEAQGFVDVTNVVLPASPIVITVPGAAPVGTYNATIIVRNSGTGCASTPYAISVTINPLNTITLSSAPGTDAQTVCINTAITPITYATTGATGASFSGLPAGVNGNWAANVVTISGSPSASGTFNYTVTLTGGCGVVTANGSITVTPDNTITLSSAPGTDAQTVCINAPITNITYTTTGATGANFSGLPAGVTGNWAANVVTISGSPSASGTFNYTVTLTGGCGVTTANGSITVTPNNTIILTSGPGSNSQTVCINTPIGNITYLTTGATGANFSGLPAGVTGNWAANVVTISGTPTASGTFNYTITLTGGCGNTTANGSITVNPPPIISPVITQPTTCVSADGAIDLTISGPAGPYTYAWSTSGGSGLVNGVEDQTGLTVGQYTVLVTAANGCQGMATFNLVGPGGCSICPTIGSLTTNPSGSICDGTPVTITASGLTFMGVTYGITFKYSTVALADPYSGGTVIATVPNGSLTGGGTIATTTTTFPASANYIIYAILSPIPIDPFCRPSNQVNLAVNAVPTVDPVANQVVCNGANTAAVNFSGAVPGTVYNWINNNTTIGLAANGTGDIASFVATNSGTAPVVATVTVTPSSTTTAPMTQTFTYTGGLQSFTVPAGVTSLNITAKGAQGGDVTSNGGPYFGGKGAIMSGDFTVTPGSILQLIVGGKGNPDPSSSGGGGGSGVNSSGTPLIVAGGGAGVDFQDPSYFGLDAVITNNGVDGNANGGSGGTIGNDGGDWAYTPTNISRGGRGWNAGNSGSFGQDGISSNTTFTNGTWGLGGGGGSVGYGWCNCGGGGGGYSGGGSGNINQSGGGGGSYNAGTNQANTGGANTGDGTIIITYNAPAATCTGTPITFTYTVNPTPVAVATPASQTICSGATITTIVLSSAVSGTTYTWSRNNTGTVTGIAANGSGNISGALTNTTAAPITVTFTIIPTANGCPGAAITATVLVNPTPNAVATPASQTICSGASITTIVLSGSVAGTTYNWTRDNTVAVTGIAANGSGNISGALTNTTPAPVTVTFTITPTANGCSGTPITATVLVNPIPNAVATPASQTVCSATPITTIVLSGAVTGTTFNWTRNNTATVTGIAASGSGNISGTLTNTTNAPITVTFTITPTANGCSGAPINATVLVNPTPTVTQGTMQVVITGDGNFADEITWTLTNSIGTVVLSGGPYGFNPPPTFSATTPATNAPFSFFIEANGTFNDNSCLWEVRCNGVVVSSGCIRGSASSSGCGNTGTLTVPNISGCGSNLGPQTICSGSAITPIILSGGVAGTVFNWTRNNTATVTGIPASGTGNISGTLTNTTNAPVVVTFTITPSANGCNGTPVNVNITVNPTPNAVATPAAQTICTGTAITPIVLTSAVSGTTYTWTRNNTATVTGIPANGSGNISGVLTNTTGLPVTVTFTITPSANGCPGTPITATVTVNQTLTITCPANITAPSVVGGCTAVVTYAPVVVGTPAPTLTYSLSGATTGSGSGTGSGLPFNVGVTTVTLTATNSCGTAVCSFTITVTDSQLPVIGTQPSNRTVCTGSSATFSVVATNVVTYQWQQWNGTTWVNVAGANAANFTLNNVAFSQNTNTFRAVLNGLCTIVISNPASLYVNALPSINLSTSRIPILLPTESVTITATTIPTGGTYTWFRDGVAVPGVTGPVLANLTVDDVGTYRVRYTDPNGCISTSADIVVSAAASSNLIVYPNPNDGRFHVRFYNQTNEQVTLIVYDAKGARVHYQTVATSTPYTRMDVDISGRPAGVYLVEVRNSKGEQVGAKRIIVGH